jgi:hypothetical protein
METFEDFDAAVTAKGEGEQVCGTLLKSGEPRYFLMPADAADEEVRDRAFQVREGREISTYEQFLIQQATELRLAAMA